MVKHSFDCLLSFPEPLEIRTVAGFSAVFVVRWCEHRLCSQTWYATGYAAQYDVIAIRLDASVPASRETPLHVQHQKLLQEPKKCYTPPGGDV